MYPATQQRTPQHTGSHMISTRGQALPLKSTRVSAVAHGGIARVTLMQVFENPYREALSVTYSLPLPSDSAVSGFAFTLQDRRVVGEVDRKAKARERYQRALSEGRSAALLEQDRSSLFTQEVGNIPPRSSITVEISLDQRLLWLPEGAWEWRFPTVVAPRYLGAEGQTKDPARVAQVISQEALPASLTFGVMLKDALVGAPSSTSHALIVQPSAQGALVSLEPLSARKDQDIVVRWQVSTREVGASLSVCRPAIGGLDHLAFGLLTLVPPAIKTESVARDLILLLDVSGSMSGAPIHQLKQVSIALIETLTAQDQLEIVVFANSARRWKKTPVHGTEESKREAIDYIKSIQSSGGTDMKAGIIKALAPLRRDSQRQVILMTDGHIGFEEEIVKEVYARLPVGSRVHTLGIGSSVNRSLTTPVARAGAGVEQIVGLNESAEVAAHRLVVRTASPLVVGLSLGGAALLEACPSRLPDLYAGSPSLLSLKLRPEGGELTVDGYTAAGPWKQVIQVPPMTPQEGEQAIAALYAREAVEDLEMALAAGKPRREVDQEIEDLGVAFQIATRLTSWVAISKEATVEVEAPARHAVMPQELPAGMNAADLGLRPVASPEVEFKKEALKEKSREELQSISPSNARVLRMPVTPKAASPIERDEDKRAAPEVSAPPSSGEMTKLEEEMAIVYGERAEEDIEEVEESDAPAARFDAMPIDDERRAPAKPKPSPMPARTRAKPTKQRAQAPITGKEEKKSLGPVRVKRAAEVSAWRGVIKESSAQEVVIEFVLPEAFVWRPTSFTLFFAGGSVALSWNPGKSTPAGSFAAGATIKVTLNPGGLSPQGAIERLSFASDGKRFTIELV